MGLWACCLKHFLKSCVQVSCELFCEAAVRHAEGKVSIFDRLENLNITATDTKMPEHANLETVS